MNIDLTFRSDLLLVFLIILFLNGCAGAYKKPYSLKDKEPIYLQTSGKDAYHFSLMVTRQLYRHQTRTTDSLADAVTLVKFDNPKCNRFVIFTDSQGQRRDYFIKCQLDYEARPVLDPGKNKDNPAPKVSSSLLATSILTRTDNLSGYFRKETEIEEELHQDLARQLVLALSTISFENN